MENRTCLKPPTSDLTNKNGLEFLKVASYRAFSTHSFLFFVFQTHYHRLNRFNGSHSAHVMPWGLGRRTESAARPEREKLGRDKAIWWSYQLIYWGYNVYQYIHIIYTYCSFYMFYKYIYIYIYFYNHCIYIYIYYPIYEKSYMARKNMLSQLNVFFSQGVWSTVV